MERYARLRASVTRYGAIRDPCHAARPPRIPLRSMRATISNCSPLRQRVPRHEVVRVFPARERLDAIEPDRDVLVLRRNVEAELLRRIVEIADQRKVGDGRSRTQHERP